MERKNEWDCEWMLKASKEENKRKKEKKWRKRHDDDYCDNQRPEKIYYAKDTQELFRN